MQEIIPLVGRALSNELRGSQTSCKKSVTNFYYSNHILIAILIALNVLHILFNEGLESVEIPL